MPSRTGDIACAKVLCAMGMIPDSLCVCGFMQRVATKGGNLSWQPNRWQIGLLICILIGGSGTRYIVETVSSLAVGWTGERSSGMSVLRSASMQTLGVFARIG